MALNRTELELTVKTVGQQAIKELNEKLGLTRAEAKKVIAEFYGFEKAKDVVEDFSETVLSTEKGIERYVRFLQKQRSEVQFAGNEYKQLTAEILQYQGALKKAQAAAVIEPMSAADLNTERGLQQQIRMLREQRSELQLNSNEYQQLSATIRQYEAALRSAQGVEEKSGQDPMQGPRQLNYRSQAGLQEYLTLLRDQRAQLEYNTQAFAEYGQKIAQVESLLKQVSEIPIAQPSQDQMRTVRGLQQEISRLQQRRDQIDYTSDAYAQLTAKIAEYDAVLKRVQGREKQSPAAAVEKYYSNDTLKGLQQEIAATRADLETKKYDTTEFADRKRQLAELNQLYAERSRIMLQPVSEAEQKTERGLQRQIAYLREQRGELDIVSVEYQKITSQIGVLEKRLKDAANSAKQIVPDKTFALNTEKGVQAQIAALRAQRSELSFTSQEYARLTQQINKYQAVLNKAQAGQGSLGAQVRGRILGAAGAVGATGLFGGGPVSALGAGLGFLAGGQAGAFALAGAVQGLQQSGGGMADVAAQVSRLNKVLESEAPKDYADNLAFVNEVSVATGQTIPEATRSFLKLNAAVRAAGGDAETARGVYEAIAGSIVKFGGSAQDVAGAVTAVTQVFSKGKVSAEELSGQIGERLVGAYVKFAQANGYTTKELSKFLEEGNVTLDQFIKFTRYLQSDGVKALDDYRTSTEAAGARFSNAFSNFQAVVGKILMPLGAALQDFGTNFLNVSARVIVGLAKIGEKITQFLIPAFNAFKEVVKVAAVALLQFGAIQVGLAIGNGLFAAGQAMIGFIKLVRSGTIALRAFALAQAAVAVLSGTLAKSGKAGAFGIAAMIAAGIALKDQLGPLIGGLGDAMNKAFNKIFPEVTPKVDDLKNQIKDLDPALTGLNDTGDKTKRTFEDIQKSLMGLRTDVAIQKLENEKATLDKVGQAWADYAIAKLKAKEAFEQVKGAKGVTGGEIAEAARREELQIDAARIRLREALKGIEEANKKAIKAADDNAEAWSKLLKEPGYSRSDTVQAIAKERREQLIKAFDELIKSDKETLQELLERGGAKGAATELRKRIAELEKARADGLIDNAATSFANQQATGSQLQSYVDQLSRLKIESENAAEGISQLTTAQETLLFLQQKGIDVTSQEGKDLLGLAQQVDAAKAVVEGTRKAKEEAEKLRESWQQIGTTIAEGLGSAIAAVAFATGNLAEELRNIAQNLLRQIADQILKITIVNPLANVFQGWIKGLLPFANGGIMTADGPVPLRTYARGGIANSPQMALFGEGSVPEAYVPLPDGRRIPVVMQGGGGGGSTNVVVNVDASGTKVQGDNGNGQALGRVISQAVQAELIRQKRPGGILAGA